MAENRERAVGAKALDSSPVPYRQHLVWWTRHPGTARYVIELGLVGSCTYVVAAEVMTLEAFLGYQCALRISEIHESDVTARNERKRDSGSGAGQGDGDT